MAMLVQRSPSTVSVGYHNPEQDNCMMDADEMCRLFGSLKLTAWGSVESQTLNVPKQPIPNDEPSMPVEAEMTELTDGEGNVQVSPLRSSSHSGYPFFEIYEPKQFIESTPVKSVVEEPVEGCALIHMLSAHYAPSISRLHCSTRDPDFNLLETILAHREAFVAFPYGHRTCSSALTKVAFEIERRHNAGPSDGEEADIDTAIALHNEAWLMSGWYSK